MKKRSRRYFKYQFVKKLFRDSANVIWNKNTIKSFAYGGGVHLPGPTYAGLALMAKDFSDCVAVATAAANTPPIQILVSRSEHLGPGIYDHIRKAAGHIHYNPKDRFSFEDLHPINPVPPFPGPQDFIGMRYIKDAISPTKKNNDEQSSKNQP